MDEDAIADEVLGRKSRYIVGMGYGLELASSYVSRRQQNAENIAMHEQVASLQEQ